MVELPTLKVEDIIDAHYEANYQPRERLGLSQVGHECPRYLWYKHQGRREACPGGRILRLFYCGNTVEDIVITDLKKAGFKVKHQQMEINLNHKDIVLYGHIDGIIEPVPGAEATPHLLEI
jgi:hypothetical protein